MSHPDKNGVPTIDLSKDHEADVDVGGLTETQAAIERVIKKVFSHYWGKHCHHWVAQNVSKHCLIGKR